jgi:hypothetical protein
MTTGGAKDVNSAISNSNANTACQQYTLDNRRNDKGLAEK